jgi:hypothetical protein
MKLKARTPRAVYVNIMQVHELVIHMRVKHRYQIFNPSVTIQTNCYTQQIEINKKKPYAWLRINKRRIFYCYNTLCGLGSSVGIATGCGLDGSGIESR